MVGSTLQVYYAQLMAQPEERREKWLEHLAAEQEQIVATLRDMSSSEPETVLQSKPGTVLFNQSEPTDMPRGALGPGSQLGPYQLLELLGQGGMGEVYLAQQETPLQRKVALKLVRAGCGTNTFLARFGWERRNLAAMQHEAIAAVHDAGVSADGRPYLVMEFVDGIPITDFLRKHPLSLNERLRLFYRICEGVRHAHIKGVVHRDLKPANILVSENGGRPQPKIIDFGIAKALHQDDEALTRTGILGTPAYMSPEQLTGKDVDLRSDIYALGLLLYEILTGDHPYLGEKQRVHPIVMHQIQHEQTLQKPSQRLLGKNNDTARQLRAELDWITLRALETDREQRYPSIEAFMEDLAAYLDGGTVSAMPPSALWQIRTFFRRHTLLVTSVSLLLLTLLVGLGGTTHGLMRARAAEQDMRAGFAFLKEMLRAPSPEYEGRDVTVSEVLSSGASRLEKSFAQKPDLKAELYLTLGETYRATSKYAESETYLLKALQLVDRGSNNEQQRLVRKELALTWIFQGRHSEARQSLESIITAESDLPLHHPVRLRTLSIMADLEASLRNLDKELPLLETLIQGYRETKGPYAEETLGVQINRASLLMRLGRFEEGLPALEKVHDLARNHHGERSPIRLKAMERLGQGLVYANQDNRAIPLMETCVALTREVFGEESTQALVTLTTWANALSSDRYRLQELEIRERLMHRTRAFYGRDDHPEVLIAKTNAGTTAMLAGNYEKAERLVRDTHQQFERIHGKAHMASIHTQTTLAEILSKQGRYQEAEKLFLEVIPLSDQVLGPHHNKSIKSRLDLRDLYHAWNRDADAEQVSYQVMAVEESDPRPQLGNEPNAYFRLARDAYHQDHFSEAIELSLRAEELAEEEETRGGAHWRRPRYQAFRARALAKMGKSKEAKALMSAALSMMEPHCEKYAEPCRAIKTMACEL